MLTGWEPEETCVGYKDTRPRLLHPVGADLRIGIIGLTNAGKSRLFNLLTGSDAAVSPRVFTTRDVMARRRKIPDDRLDWLANQFPQATLRSSTITFVDTPALLDPFDNVPWGDDILEALRLCDVIYLVIRAFNDASVERWKSDSCKTGRRFYYDDNYMRRYRYGEGSDEYQRSPRWHLAESLRTVDSIMKTHDKNVLAKLRENATNGDDLDAIATIEDNVRGYTDDYGRGLAHVTTDARVRYHDWTEKELDVLERMSLLTAKPIVYVMNMNADDFAIANSSESYLFKARTAIKNEDHDALVLPFAGHVPREEAKATLLNAGELSGAEVILQRTIEDCQVGHFYTANGDLVAAWAIKLGTTVEEAVTLVGATLESSVTVVEAVSMRGVVEAGSVDKALSLGMVRRKRFEDAVEDGDLLLLTPGRLDEVATGQLFLATFPVNQVS
ncbi:obg-like ATPase 1-like protein [Aphelenchoides avenae]|nr:obg-like ATPase 1-like protein [Aphelenchus avenae]